MPLPDVPFDEGWGTIPNDHGRITTERDGGEILRGEYATGWIKRGPSGVIGTNKPDSVETVECLLEDWQAGSLTPPSETVNDLTELLTARGVQYLEFADWQRLDELERDRGRAEGRPRVKFYRVEEMLALLEGEKVLT